MKRMKWSQKKKLVAHSNSSSSNSVRSSFDWLTHSLKIHVSFRTYRRTSEVKRCEMRKKRRNDKMLSYPIQIIDHICCCCCCSANAFVASSRVCINKYTFLLKCSAPYVLVVINFEFLFMCACIFTLIALLFNCYLLGSFNSFLK